MPIGASCWVVDEIICCYLSKNEVVSEYCQRALLMTIPSSVSVSCYQELNYHDWVYSSCPYRTRYPRIGLYFCGLPFASLGLICHETTRANFVHKSIGQECPADRKLLFDDQTSFSRWPIQLVSA